MLKNKFSVLKSVALVMVLLMTVAVFAACGKETNDDSAAISSALDALQSSLNAQVSQNATQSSAFQDSQEEQDKLISSMLAEQAKELEEQSKKLSEQLANDAKKQSSILASAAASQSKELAEQSKKLSSMLAEAAKTTTTTTTAPIAAEDITAQVSELSSLKLKYTVTMANYYIGDNYAKITNLFDVASLQMNNAKTVAAANDILAQVKVDAEAIPNAQNVANAFKAQVNALGDIETEVFTTSAAKVTAARKALKTFTEDYKAFVAADANWDKTLGIRTQKNELDKAEAKIKALASYMTNALTADMRKMYDLAGRVKTPDYTPEVKALVSGAYYKYQVLSVVNGGDVSDADLPIAWEYKYNEDGKIDKDDAGNKKLDLTKPTAYFTTEEMMNVFVLPWADEEFENAKDAWIRTLKDLIDDDKIVANVKRCIPALTLKVAGGSFDPFDKVITDEDGTSITVKGFFGDAEADIEDYFDAFEDELDALSYAADYKASGTLDDAKFDLFQRAVKAYAAALADVAPAFKVAADEFINTLTEDAINDLDTENKYYARDLERLNVQLTNAQAKVDAITSYALDEISTEAVRVAYAKFIGKTTTDQIKTVPALNDLLDDAANWADVKVYLEKVAAMGIANAIKGTAGNATIDETNFELADLLQTMIDDLTDFKDKFLEEDAPNYNTYRGSASTSIITGETTYKNAAKLAALKADVEKAIADLSAIKSSDYADKEVTMTNPVNKTKYNGAETAKDAKLYFQSEAAKQYAIDNGLTGKELYENSTYRSQLLTKTATSWPVTYTYTAAEQAMMAASDLYKAAYDNAANVLLACSGKKYAGSDLKKDKTVVSDFKKLVAGNAALTAEVDTLVNYYVAEIDKAMVIASKAYVTKTDYIYLEKDPDDNVVKDEPDHITVAAFTASSTKIPDDIDGAKDKADGLKKACNEGPDTNVTNLRTLWEYKTAAANKVAADVAKAKNSYKKVASVGGSSVATDITVVSAWNTWFKYDGTDAQYALSGNDLLTAKVEPSAKGTAYEVAVDSLISSYNTKIMGVTMNNAEVEVKNWVGDTLFAKAKVGYSLAKAKTLVDAYAKDILGTNTVQTVQVKNDSSKPIYTGAHVDSKVFDLWFRTFSNTYLYDAKEIVAAP